MMNQTKLFRPKRLEDALSLLNEHPSARLIFGGTDILPAKRAHEIEINDLVAGWDLQLDYIRSNNEGIRIGAASTLHNIETSELLNKGPYHILKVAANRIASRQVRNIATIGGNVCWASPSADMPPVLIALDSMVKIVSLTKERVIPVEEFAKGVKKTVLNRDEIVTEFFIPSLPANSGGSFQKFGRTSHDIALVNVAVRLTLKPDETCEDVKIALGAVAPTPIRALKTEKLLRNKKIENKLIVEAAETVSEEIKPINDVRASAEYRRELTKILVKRAINNAIKNCCSSDD